MSTMVVTEVGNIKVVSHGKTIGLDGSCRVQDCKVMEEAGLWMHEDDSPVNAVSLTRRCPCQNRVRNGGEPSNW